MGKTLILLFGGRPQPNVILAAIEKPDRIVAIVSQDSLYDLHQVFDALMEKEKVEVRKVSPYNMRDVRQVIEETIQTLPVSAIGVTGAPLPTAVVAYGVGREHGIPVYYVNTRQGELLNLIQETGKPTPVKLRIPAFLRVYRLTPEPLPTPQFATSPRQRRQAARILGENAVVAGQLLGWLRKGTKKPNGDGDPLRIQKLWPEYLNASHWDLFERLHSAGIVRVKLSRGRTRPVPRSVVQLKFPKSGERQFIFGKWLEIYIEDAARRVHLLDDVASELRFRVQEGYREIDFLGLYQGIPILGSCKATNKPWRKSYLDELSAVAEMMGGRYTWKFFFTDQEPPFEKEHNAYRSYTEFKDHARSLRVVVLTAQDLPQWAEILEKELNQPTYPLV